MGKPPTFSKVVSSGSIELNAVSGQEHTLAGMPGNYIRTVSIADSAASSHGDTRMRRAEKNDSWASKGGGGWHGGPHDAPELDPVLERSISAQSDRENPIQKLKETMQAYVPSTNLSVGPVLRPEGKGLTKVVRTAIVNGKEDVIAIRHLNMQEPPPGPVVAQMAEASSNTLCCGFRGWSRSAEGNIVILLETAAMGSLQGHLKAMASHGQPLPVASKIDILEQVMRFPPLTVLYCFIVTSMI